MKSKSQKYEEAIARNIEVSLYGQSRKNLSLHSMKNIVGIRRDDERFDNRINDFRHSR